MAVNSTFTPEPSRELEDEVRRARITGQLLIEARARRAYWIGGVPTELDTFAMCKAVAQRLYADLEEVEAVWAAADKGRG